MSNTDTPNTNLPNAATLLEFANLQVAAEALYKRENLTEFKIDNLKYLKDGNERTRKFTAPKPKSSPKNGKSSPTLPTPAQAFPAHRLGN